MKNKLNNNLGNIQSGTLNIPQIPSVCPNCGHCPTCGRSNAVNKPYTPYTYPNMPWGGQITGKNDGNVLC